MDPLSISASIAGLITLADVVYSRVFDYCKEVKGAAKDVVRLSAEVALLAGTLRGVHLVLTNFESEDDTASQTASIHIHDCQMLLDGIDKKLKHSFIINSGAKKILKQLQWPFEASDMKRLLGEIERLKATFNLALTADSMSVLMTLLDGQKRSAEDLRTIKATLHQITMDKKRKEIFRFFNRADPTPNHEMSLKLRHPNTGLWFVEGETFQKWLQGAIQHLWLFGIPGSGKTVLAASIIQTAIEHHTRQEAVAYFYCDYKDQARQDPSNILGSILSQLAIQDESAFEDLQSYYQTLQKFPGQTSSAPDPEDLLDLICIITAFFDTTSVIVDGLDECGENTDEIVQLLLSLGKKAKGAIRTVLLSRDEPRIRRHIASEEYATISIAAQSGDLKLYVGAEIETRIRKGKLRLKNQDLKLHIMQTLVEKAQGMFRWVACQMDYLCALPSDAKRREALKTLPPTLHETYERILHRVLNCDASIQDLVEKTLLWVFFSKEPLSVEALCHAVSFQEDTETLDPEAVIDEEEILHRCSSLIRMSTDGSKFESAHFTVQEYFSSINPETHPILARFAMKTHLANLKLGTYCLAYLNLADFCSKVPKSDEDMCCHKANFPFYGHAAYHWNAYASFHWKDTAIVRLAESLFHPRKSSNFLLWRYYRCYLGSLEEGLDLPSIHESIVPLCNNSLSTLYYAAFLGEPDLIERLLFHGLDPNPNSSSIAGSPLHWAILGKILHNWSNGKSTSWARSRPEWSLDCWEIEDHWNYDRKACVQKLLASGAEPKTLFPWDETIHFTALELSLYTLDASLIDQMLSHGFRLESDAFLRLQNADKVDWREYDLKHTTFFLTLNPDIFSEECRDAFLEFSNGMKMDTGLSNTAQELQDAVKQDQIDVLERLLANNNQNVDSVNPSTGETALHVAANNGSLRCLQLLLQKGARIDKKDLLEQTALHHAAQNPDTQCAILLLDQGLDPNVGNSSGHNLWHLAAEFDNSELLSDLFSRFGEDPPALRALDEVMNTPLLTAAASGSDNAVNSLLRPDQLQEKYTDGHSLLHRVAENCLPETLFSVIGAGADATSKTDNGSTLLHLLVQNRRTTPDCLSSVQSLGVSATDCRNGGQIPLHDLFNIFSSYQVEELLDAISPESSVNLTDETGQTPLHYMVRSKLEQDVMERLLQKLCTKGANPHVRDDAGKSCFQLLVYQLRDYNDGYESAASIQMVKNLTENAPVANLEETIEGIRPLNIVLSTKELAMAFLAKGVDPDLRNTDGDENSALEIACIDGCDAEVFKTMLAASKNLGAPNKQGKYLIHVLCDSHSQSDLGLFELVLKSGIVVNARDRDGRTAVVDAIRAHRNARLRMLISYGASLDSEDVFGWTPVHCAAYSENIKALRILQSTDVDWKAKTSKFTLKCDNETVSFDGLNALHLAAMEDCSAVIRFLLESTPLEVHCETRDRCTPLHFAASYGGFNSTRVLLENGASVSACDENGNVPLHYSAKQDNWETGQLLLEHGSPQPRNKEGFVPGLLALSHGNEHFSNSLRAFNATNRITPSDGQGNIGNPLENEACNMSAALSVALQAGDREAFMNLMSESKDLDQWCQHALPFNEGSTRAECQNCSFLFAALNNRKVEIARWLIDSGCSLIKEVSCSSRPQGYMAIHFVAEDPTMTQEFLQSLLDKTPLSALRSAPISPLHVAVHHGNNAAVDMLLRHFCPTSITAPTFSVTAWQATARLENLKWFLEQDNPPEMMHGFYPGTSLHVAAYDGNVHIVQALLDHGADPNNVDNQLCTALHRAVLNDSVEVVQLLLSHGANPNAITRSGASVLMEAAKAGDLAVLQALAQYSLDFTWSNSYGEKALHYASTAPIYAFLLSHGGDISSQARYNWSPNHWEYVLFYEPHLSAIILDQADELSDSAIRYDPTYFKRVCRRLIRSAATKVNPHVEKEAALGLLSEAALGGDLPCLDILLDSPYYRNAEGGPLSRPLQTACRAGRLESVRYLLSKGASNAWPTYDILSVAFTSAKYQKHIQQWLIKDRFTEKLRLTQFQEHEDACKIHDWAGIWTIKMPRVGRYTRKRMQSSIEYATFLGSIDKDVCVEYSLDIGKVGLESYFPKAKEERRGNRLFDD